MGEREGTALVPGGESIATFDTRRRSYEPAAPKPRAPLSLLDRQPVNVKLLSRTRALLQARTTVDGMSGAPHTPYGP